MTKLGTVDFDDRILDALRDERLVVFAGAGVSMGPPANLPSFWSLCRAIAQGTGQEPSEPLDRFLGQLHHREIMVHERAVKVLAPAGSAPNALHHDLLRLFRTADRVRVVTTNFDRHFETAANGLFGAVPDVYCAPALPKGRDFAGIVHVHGALPRARDLVLTDADFGRAYLTEGWARRFLMEAFSRYTVLFVGYGHGDVVMNYLARALPAEGVSGRFALTEEDGSWELLGIQPLRFAKSSVGDPYQGLYDGVRCLADRASRGALDWESRLAELGGRTPPTDEEAISEVEQALREVHTTRFLLDVARAPEWLQWLNGRKHLEGLFSNRELSDREVLLAEWVAKHFALQHAEEVFEVVAANGLRIHGALWWECCRALRAWQDRSLAERVLERWVTILLASAPAQVNHQAWLWLADCCAAQGCTRLVLAVFQVMCEHRLSVRVGVAVAADEGSGSRRRFVADCVWGVDHWSLSRVWTEYLKPQRDAVAQLVITGVAWQFDAMHRDLVAWGRASRRWDPITYGRSAIEPHEQDRFPKSVDVLIDAARDSLESLAVSDPALLEAWVESLVASEVPMLRRLAVHAMTALPGWTPEQRLMWLLRRVGLHELAEHHEVHRAVAESYVAAAEPARRAVVEAVLSHAAPETGDGQAEEVTARRQFAWLSWLLLAKPDCSLARAALAPLQAMYPDWALSDHPDLTHWIGSVGWIASESPWSVEQLRSAAPSSLIESLVGFEGSPFKEPSREGLLNAVREVCKQSPDWAVALAHALRDRALWASDFWPALLQGVEGAELTPEVWRELLVLVSNPLLRGEHVGEVANLLHALVKDGGKTWAVGLLEHANAIAIATWDALDGISEVEQEGVEDWLTYSINRPAGIIVEFWLEGLALLVREATGAGRSMPEDYRKWFTLVLRETSAKGDAGRSILASQAGFLYSLDEAWTREHLLPLFRHSERRVFAQAWSGFLVWGRVYPALVEALLPAVVEATARLSVFQGEQRRLFVDLCAALAVFHIAAPGERLLPALLSHGTVEDRARFAAQVGYFLRQAKEPAAQQLWKGWLRDYWQERQEGMIAPLEDAEVREMLGWLPHLGDCFAEGVMLTVRGAPIQLEHAHAVFELRDSSLVVRFPEKTADLLTYLASCKVGYHASDLAYIAERLPPIPEHARTRLDEAFARAGISRRRK